MAEGGGPCHRLSGILLLPGVPGYSKGFPIQRIVEKSSGASQADGTGTAEQERSPKSVQERRSSQSQSQYSGSRKVTMAIEGRVLGAQRTKKKRTGYFGARLPVCFCTQNGGHQKLRSKCLSTDVEIEACLAKVRTSAGSFGIEFWKVSTRFRAIFNLKGRFRGSFGFFQLCRPDLSCSAYARVVGATEPAPSVGRKKPHSPLANSKGTQSELSARVLIDPIDAPFLCNDVAMGTAHTSCKSQYRCTFQYHVAIRDPKRGT
eukprot:1070955-Rhodomonas_salina.1